MTQRPLVTLAMPVRNGAPMLAQALDSMLAQDYPNIEIVVSDNASSDATPDILCDYAARHPTIRIIRQPRVLSAIDNFLSVMTQARGEYFAWCAHDDSRSPDFVSGLMTAFADPDTVLAFGDLYIWDGAGRAALRADYDFANAALPRWRRLRKAAHMQCYHVYGLWRTSALRAIRYRTTHWWSDMPLALAAASLGVFRHVPGPKFLYFEIIKTAAEAAQYHGNLAHQGRLHDLLSLLRAVFVTMQRTAGLGPALLATAFIVEKYLRRAGQILVGRRNVVPS